MAIRRLFTDHPASVGESYLQHMAHASHFAARMMLSGAACMVHAALPFLFVQTGSKAVTELNDRMILNRVNCAPSSATQFDTISSSPDSS